MLARCLAATEGKLDVSCALICGLVAVTSLTLPSGLIAGAEVQAHRRLAKSLMILIYREWRASAKSAISSSISELVFTYWAITQWYSLFW
jgi:hypothetical protein